jgi:large repetitive protein
LFLALVPVGGCGDGSDPDVAFTGGIQVAVTTSGADPDPDGYLATLDGNEAAVPLPATGSASFDNVAVGDHMVALGGLASNCTADASSKGVTVNPAAIARVSFTISCSAVAPTVGSIRVVTSTIGSNLDTDGYQFAIDDGTAQAIGTSATATLNDVALGAHTVVISAVAVNCGIPSGWFKAVTVVAGETADAVFPITCYEMGPSASVSTVQVDPASIPVGFPGQIFLPMSTITVTVVDANGTPLRGLAVTLNATGTGNTVRPWPSALDSWMTNASGVATFSLSSTVPEDKTITAVVNGVLNLDDTPVVTVVKGLSIVGLGNIVPEPSTAGQPFVVTVSVSGERGSRPTGGTVAVSSNLEPDAGCDAVPLSPGGDTYSTATCEMSLSIVSTHMLTATYSGDSQFEGSSSSEVQHVVIAP